MIFKSKKNGQNESFSFQPEFSAHYDVIIAGGGTAGVIAAIAAAEHGTVLCIERTGFLGGMGAGIVLGYYYGKTSEEFLAKMDKEICKESARSYCECKEWCHGIHPDAKKQYWQMKLESLGAEIAYQSMITGVWMEENRIVGVRILQNAVFRDVSCGYVIDATAEATVCSLAGFPVKNGREPDGQCQCYSLVGFVENSKGQLEHVYRDNGYVDTSDCFAVSRAITAGYADMDDCGAYSNEENHSLLYLGALFGKREGVSSVGEHTLSGKEILTMQPVEKPLFYTSDTYDSHLHDSYFESEDVQDYLNFVPYHVMLNQPVPMGSIIPKGSKGLLTAGLSMDISHEAWASVRLKRNVIRSGEAAAMTAVISLKEGKAPEECYESIRQEMIRRGIYMDTPELDPIFAEISRNIKKALSSSEEKLKNCAVYYAAKNLSKEQLQEYLKEQPTEQAAAEALALQGNDDGIERLIIPERKYIYLVSKADKQGKYTKWMIDLLENKELFRWVFSGLVRYAARGNEQAEKAIRKQMNHPQFSFLLSLNGQKNRTVLERKETFRAYANYYLEKQKGLL